MTQDVPRETSDRLRHFEELLRKWNPKINLVSAATLKAFRERHVEDSLQISRSVQGKIKTWVDLGSGGGFPGLVVAIDRQDCRVILVESDHRKAAFLRAAARELALDVEIRAERIEALPTIRPDVISARALASLPKLLSLAYPISGSNTLYLFAKGETFREELEQVRDDWRFTEEVIPSRTRTGSVILKLRNVERA